MVDILAHRSDDPGAACECGERQESATDSTARFEQAVADALFEATPDGVIVSDAEGQIVRANASAERMFGCLPGRLVGEAVDRLLPESLREGHARHRETYRRSPAARHMGRALELSARRTDGVEFPVAVSLCPLACAGAYVVAVVRDMTDHTMRAGTLRQREAQLREVHKMEALGRLAGGVAHDFNNVLGVILALAGELASTPGLGPDALGTVHEISAAAGRAAQVTRQLLAVSRKQVLTPAPVDLNAVVVETLKLLRPTLREDVTVRLELAPGVPAVHADYGQMIQVVMNLLFNARDAITPPGVIEVKTRHESVCEPPAGSSVRLSPGEYVELAVRDSGQGIAPETLPHIFEPFFTTKRESRGTGLGLSIVHGIVTQLGGAVAVSSCPGEGSVFTLHMPVAARGPDESNDPQKMPPGPLPRIGSTVLVVEDEVPMRRAIARILRGADYTVLEAASAPEAVDAFLAHGPGVDLVVTDVLLPGMSGAELVSRLRQSGSPVRVLFMSGYADLTRDTEVRAVRSAPFLNKPFTRDTLLDKVRELLAHNGSKPEKEHECDFNCR